MLSSDWLIFYIKFIILISDWLIFLAVEKMLQIITEKLQQGICDDVMETAW